MEYSLLWEARTDWISDRRVGRWWGLAARSKKLGIAVSFGHIKGKRGKRGSG